MSKKYYVAGCVDNGLSAEVVDDEDAEFWTLYERDSEGLSEAIIDCVSRKEAETAMAVYVERDALQEQVRALAAEVQTVREQSEEVYAAGYNHGHLDTVDGIAYAPTTKDEFYHNALQVIAETETPSTDAILREVRARELDVISDELTALDTVGSTGAIAYVIRQKAAAIRAGEVTNV